MGITIHYSGHANNWDAISSALNTAQLFAAERGWMFALFDDPFGVTDDHDEGDPALLDHEGPFRGIVLRPHRSCEPVRLRFTAQSELLPASTKTQFAPFEIHADLVALLRQIEPHMDQLEVLDEAGLWDSADAAAARAEFEALGRTIDAMAEGLAEIERANDDFGGLPDLPEDNEAEPHG